ncbi:MAG TPA: hypothetical protein VG253_28540 [Streptosporangiaceae bacterium]|nr:hypothetical protein [Streptosporangiaceae bacterium]
MNALDRKVSGSNRNVASPMIVSRSRATMPMALETALNTTATRIDATISTSIPVAPPG